MWSWDRRRAQTLSPGSANRQYSSIFSTKTGSKTSAASVPTKPTVYHNGHQPSSQRISHSGIPWGYYTTRSKPFTSPVNDTTSHTSSEAALNRKSAYDFSSGQVIPKDNPYSLPRAQIPTHQYSRQKGQSSKSQASVSGPTVQQQSKHAPIQKRIDKSRRERFSSANSSATPSESMAGNMSVNPLYTEDKDPAPVHAGSQNGSLRGEIFTRNKWADNKSNSAVHEEFVENSLYHTSRNSHIADGASDSDASAGPNDREVASFDQDVPLYASVFKNKTAKPLPREQNAAPASPAKKDEPVYSTIGDKAKKDLRQSGPQHTDTTQGAAASGFNRQSLHDQIRAGVQLKKTKSKDEESERKEQSPRKMSVLDELKLRFTGKKGILKSTKPPMSEATGPDQAKQGAGNGDSFNPAVVLPKPPPAAEPASLPVQSSYTPPPPRFSPPPPPPQVASSLQEDPTTDKEGSDSKIQTVSEGGQDITSQTNVEADTGVIKTESDDEESDGSESSSGDGSSLPSDSEGSTTSNTNSVHETDGRPKSILKNKYEKPLVDKERLMPLSDSEEEEDASNQKETTNIKADDGDDDDQLNSLERRGVSFTTDTLDNEGTAKRYEKEGLQMLKIDRTKELPPDIQIPMPSKVVETEDVDQAEERPSPSQQSDAQPSDVVIDVQQDVTDEVKEEDNHKSGDGGIEIVPLPNIVADPDNTKRDTPDPTPQQFYTFKSSVPQDLDKPKTNGLTLVNGSLPKESVPVIVQSQTLPTQRSKRKDQEMYFTLRKTGDNISVVNISQDDTILDNVSQRMTMDRYAHDTLRSNMSVGTLRTMISIGGASDLSDVQISAYPRAEDDTLEHSIPFKAEMFEYRKQQTTTGKYQKKANRSKQTNTKSLKKTTFVEQSKKKETKADREKKQRRRKICRIASFVIVVVVIVIVAALVIYFLLANDQSSEEMVTATPT